MSEFKFNSEHLSIIKNLKLDVDIDVLEAAYRDQEFNSLSEQNLFECIKIANALYRSGTPVLSDNQYDLLLLKLTNEQPDHPYLTEIEPEVMFESKTVSLPQKMLSTDKAYSFIEIEKWVDKIMKAAEELDINASQVKIRITPKLDGYAAFDDGQVLYTRGNGVRGQDITRAFNRGLKVANNGERGLGPGEIVISKRYFDDVLNLHFENSRNIQAAIIAEKNVDENVQKAIDEGACVFYPFELIDHWTGDPQELLSNFESIVEKIWHSVEYDIDGVVLETTDEKIKEHMGSTRKHHRWQIAFKVNEEAAEVEVIRVIAQTSRTGRVSPVAELVPTKLSGATITRATVHHYRMVESNGVGKGAIVRLVRSGLVIPKIEKVIKKVTPQIPDKCPSCSSLLEWVADHLMCKNLQCSARKENTIIYFFKTLGNNDGFGPKVIEKLHLFGVDHVHQVYELSEYQLKSFGFGEKTAQNLVGQLRASREIEIEDWRFLSAFGVNRLGAGNCEKLLKHHSVLELFELTVEDMITIDGFADVSAQTISQGLNDIKEDFTKVYELGFNLGVTPKQLEQSNNGSPIAGKLVVFTGAMTQGGRGDMEKEAKLLGATIGKSVSGKTDFLVTGNKVGENKINAARAKGVQVITEEEYLKLLEES